MSESVQNGYSFVHERCDVSDVNDNLVKNFTYKCVKVNPNRLYLNFSFISNGRIINDRDGQISVSSGFFRGNQYRKGPVEFKMPYCEGMNRKEFDIPNLLKDSNVQCPILKGVFYYGCNIEPNATNFPPFIPEGRWKLIIKFIVGSETAFSVNWYAKVVYPLPVTL
ncbi:hypothetical protein PPYR_01959 [Photinus pyralis]|uniref:MD-2-related lipid-recognition domain-containing protein n=1 Tax=Photinus pyralis TaxID=7054 RepID=A0A5N4B5V5_PHOPY|nr:uncharacterized protein LOC116167384 [Photinus pyralis]XP_031352839.1 uncharacterized protein LOC116177843 [Photinus pyralis]KAB0804989.1 hypothetical protein PPYR_01959 [Photinus pyralis]